MSTSTVSDMSVITQQDPQLFVSTCVLSVIRPSTETFLIGSGPGHNWPEISAIKLTVVTPPYLKTLHSLFIEQIETFIEIASFHFLSMLFNSLSKSKPLGTKAKSWCMKVSSFAIQNGKKEKRFIWRIRKIILCIKGSSGLYIFIPIWLLVGSIN